MRWLLIPLLATLVGCRSDHSQVSHNVEAQLAAVAPARPVPDFVPAAAALPSPDQPLDLPGLWDLALAKDRGSPTFSHRPDR
jgi:hypothetical protein